MTIYRGPFQIGQQFKAFVKAIDKPCQADCELKALSFQAGFDDQGRAEVLYIDVEPNAAYASVIVPATENRDEVVQVGIELRDGERRLFTANDVTVLMPRMVGMEVLTGITMNVLNYEICP